MNRLAVFSALALLGASLLGACAPLAAQSRSGRIVNVQTGQEGVVVFGGTGVISGSGPVAIVFGEDRYEGTFNVVSAARYTRPTLAFDAGIVFSNVAPPTYFAAPVVRQTELRDGSIIARDAQGRVIACEFVVDYENRGNGTCTDGTGTRYAMQF